MGGSKKRKLSKEKRVRTQLQRERQKANKRKRKRIAIGATIGAVLTVFSLPSSLSVFLSKISVTFEALEDITEALSPKFRISNESTFSVYDVTPTASYSGIASGRNKVDDISVEVRPKVIPEIEPGSRPSQFIARNLEFLPITTENRIDFRLRIRFRPAWVWWHREVRRQFSGHSKQDRVMEWEEVPWTEPNK